MQNKHYHKDVEIANYKSISTIVALAELKLENYASWIPD